MGVKKGLNANGIQEKNRSTILRILSDKKECTRAELAKLTGLTPAAITINISALIEKGLVRESDSAKYANGRKMMTLSICNEQYKVIAAKISRSNFEISICDIGGNVCETHRESVSNSARETFERFMGAVEKIYERSDDIYAVGVAVPGPYLRKEGRIALMTEFSDWSSINIVSELQSKFDIPVYVEHDANAAALATWLYGEHDDRIGTLACLEITEGVGAGVIEDGKILTGYSGIAGQIGHVSVDPLGPRCQCGNYGCLEMYCSTRTVEQLAGRGLAAHPESILNHVEFGTSCEAVINGIRKEDAFCTEIINRVGFYVGCGIVNIIHAYDPHTVVVYTDLNQCGDVFETAVKRTVENRTIPELRRDLRIKFTNPQIDYIILGAAAVAANELLKNPNLILDRLPEEKCAD